MSLSQIGGSEIIFIVNPHTSFTALSFLYVCFELNQLPQLSFDHIYAVELVM